MKNLKFSALLITLMTFVATSANAQKFHYGVAAGTNFAVQSGIAEYYDNSDIRVGLHAGLAESYAFNDNIALRSELTYDQKGRKTDAVTDKYDYITLPVLFDYSFKLSDQSGTRMRLNAGPFASYLVNAESETSDATIDLKSDSNDMEAGVIMGIGLEQPVGNHSIYMDIRLNLGLTNYSKNDDSSHNKMIGLSLGYRL